MELDDLAAAVAVALEDLDRLHRLLPVREASRSRRSPRSRARRRRRSRPTARPASRPSAWTRDHSSPGRRRRTRSGWSRWPSSSTPSTSRGPGREKDAAASTARRRRPRARERARRGRPPRLGPASAAYSPQGITTTTSGRAAATSSQRTVARRSPRPVPSGVDAAGELDHLRHPVAAGEGRVEPLERDAPAPASAPATASRTASSRALELGPQRGSPASAAPATPAERDGVVEDLAERRGVEREDARLGRQPLGDGADVVVGDGADLAELPG